jgi:quercetin dioxygenase-like cupin family protein
MTIGDKAVEVDKAAGEVSWLPAQRHAGHNIGDTGMHVLFVVPKTVEWSGSKWLREPTSWFQGPSLIELVSDSR